MSTDPEVLDDESRMISVANVLQSFRFWPRVFRMLWQTHASLLIVIMALTVFRGVSPIITLLLTQNLINSITDSWGNGFEVLLWAFASLTAFAFLIELTSLLNSYVSRLFETMLTNRVNRMIMQKAISLSLKDFENAEVQDALKRAQNEAGHRPYQILQQMMSLFSGLVTLISAVGMLVAFKWWMAFLLIIMPITSFYSFLKIGQQEFLIQWRRAPKMRQTWYFSYLMTKDTNFKEVKLYQLGNYLLRRYNALFEHFLQEDKGMLKKRLSTGFLFQSINQVANAGMMLVVLWSAYLREIQIGNVVALTQTIVLTQSNSQALITGLLNLCQHNLYLQQLFEFLDLPEEQHSKEDLLDLSEIETIEFRGVTFRYPDRSAYALRDVSFTVHRGQTLAIVGRNGSGKTTLVKLLTQLYDDFEGDILINGISIRRYDREALLRRIGVVFQDFVQYELKMRHNIGFGNVDRLDEDDKLHEAAERAGIDRMLEQMPDQLETQMGRLFEQGHQLSGGQWQRVAIARAFMRDADLYALDEPSSMLDPEAEMEIFEKFRELIQERIGLFISHRYTAIKYADHILMMDGGRIVEQGNHQELMERGGMYAHLYNVQVSAYVETASTQQAVWHKEGPAMPWASVTEEDLKERVMRTVKEIAGRMTDPAAIREEAMKQAHERQAAGKEFIPWTPLELARGYAGLCVLFGALDRAEPNGGWDEVGHRYVVEMQQVLTSEGVSNPSLWTGLAGVVLGARALSRGGERYANFMQDLNRYFLQGVPNIIRQAEERLAQGPVLSDFDVVQGLSGMGRYLLHFADVPEMRSALEQVLHYMVRLCDDRTVGDERVPGWYTAMPSDPNGHFNCGLSHGIPGPLALMALCSLHGVEVPGQRDAMKKVGAWLMRWKGHDEYGPIWPARISWEEHRAGELHGAVPREAWCYGGPGVARALWLAGAVLREEEWQAAALAAFHGTALRPEAEWNFESDTFCHGWAGLLQMVQRMFAESGDERLRELRDRLLHTLLEKYSAGKLYGFQEENHGEIQHIAGLLDGAAGVLVVLLGLLEEQESDWDSVFLIR